MIGALMRTQIEIDRRSFLRRSGAIACGLSAAAAFLPISAPAAQAGEAGPNMLGPRDGYSPQIGTLVSMLNWMRRKILGPVQGLTVAQLDHLHDPKANSIGALLLHLAAIERVYQIHTFEGKKWEAPDAATEKLWGPAGDLGQEARKIIKGHALPYYLDKLKQVREHTLTELRKRDDAWLMQADSDSTNNYCKWFHVCEHESHHNGQITWLKSRLPG